MVSRSSSDSGLEFRLIPLDVASPGVEPVWPSGDLPVIDFSSDAPLPDFSDNEFGLGANTPASLATVDPVARKEGGIWMEGDVLMCACPDCQAPMTIRLWLMVADCWKCSTSIELNEQQERQARRLMEQREAARRPQPGRSAPVPTTPPTRRVDSAASAPSSRSAPPAAAAPATAPPRPAPPPAGTREPAASAVPLTASPKRPARPNGRPGPASTAAPPPPARRVAASQNLARRRIVKRRGPAGWLANLLRHTPAWLVSLVFHLILLTLLALLTLPGDDDSKYITLNSTVSRDLQRAGQEEIKNPADEIKFDLPIPKNINLADHKTREAMVRADQEARELRLVDNTDPMPDLSVIKKQIGNPDGDTVALVSRDPRVRVEILKQEGGTTLTEAAVARGLRWIVSDQEPDGHWELNGGPRSDSAATSLALLPFLGAGQTHLNGRYKSQVAHGLGWLVSKQKEDGDLRANSSGNTGMYAHGQGAIVLCEAFLMTGDEELRVPAQKSIDFICEAQYPDGGWRYKPNSEASSSERRSDTSVVGWQLMALQSARAANLTVPEETFELASHFLDTAQTNDGARYAYQPKSGAKPSMTAEGLLCRVYLGWNKENPALGEGAQWLLDEHMPSRRNTDLYYWYYGTQTMHHIGGQQWETWNLRMRDILVDSQEKSGPEAGSWKPEGPHTAGRLYMTSLSVCSLEVYYRHLPLFRQIDLE